MSAYDDVQLSRPTSKGGKYRKFHKKTNSTSRYRKMKKKLQRMKSDTYSLFPNQFDHSLLQGGVFEQPSMHQYSVNHNISTSDNNSVSRETSPPLTHMQ